MNDRRAAPLWGRFVVALLLAACGRGSSEATSPSNPAEEPVTQEQAMDQAAQFLLRNALVAAQAHLAQEQVYVGFNAAAGSALDGSVTWADGVASVGAYVVHVDTAQSSVTRVQMLTRSETDRYFCIRDDVGGSSPGTHYGQGETVAAAQENCGGAAWT